MIPVEIEKYENRRNEYIYATKPLIAIMCELRLIGQQMQGVQKADGSFDVAYVWINPKAQAQYEECEKLLATVRTMYGLE